MRLSRTAAAVADRLWASSRRRVGIDQVRDLLLEVEPHLAHAPARRARLRELVDELAADAVVRLPRGRAQYDRVEQPPLPRFVVVAAPAPVRSRPDAATHPWPPELRWAATLRPALRADEMEVLEAVRAFLAQAGGGPFVPVQERSLQLFGDEKRLGKLAGQRLFEPGRLTLSMLRCREVHPPFVHARISDRPVLLVLENSATYDTLCRLLDGTGPVGAVAYGAGKHFILSVAAAGQLNPVPGRILYFGDIDPDGLMIPERASETAAAHGLPPVEPAGALYALLLAGQPGDGADPRTSWLPEALRGPAAALLRHGQRLAQEHVGLDRLLANPGWLDGLERQIRSAGPGSS
jgi:hypothetical protein